MKKLQTYENFDKIDLNIRYEIRYFDNESDMEIVVGNGENEEDYDYNPYDLEEVVKQLMIYEKRMSEHLYIVKMVETKIDEKLIEKLKLKIEAEKYNL